MMRIPSALTAALVLFTGIPGCSFRAESKVERTATSNSSAAAADSKHASARVEERKPRRSRRDRDQVTAAPEIPVDRYLSHIQVLAHDELEGRDTGTRGIDIASGYIAGRFAASGLLPGGPNGTYFQSFTVRDRGELLPETNLTFSGAEVEPKVGETFSPFGFSKQGAFDGDVVFVGYGITAADKEHDDYANIEVKDKVVLMLRREPSRLAEEEQSSKHARFETKLKLAAEKGATAVLIVNPKPEDETSPERLARFRAADEDYGLPVMHVKRELANTLLAAGGLKPLDELQKTIDENKENVSAPLAGVRASGNVAYKIDDLPARNVIGVLPGMGPDKEEYVVIGGHYDHLGKRRGEIYNGADDNASGTAGVIEACDALMRTPSRNRSVICMAFSGEERGLLGAEHFVAEPTVSLGSIVAMINMDMIGRHTPDDEANMLAIQGLGTGGSFQQIVDRRTQEHGFKYLPDPSAKGPSDHAPFYEGGVPALFFFTGVHDDYHQPGDDIEKVNAKDGARITGLVYSIALDLVNGEDGPQFARVDQRANIMRGPEPLVMGVMPDMEDTGGKGWKIAQVFPGGGAAKAGMKSGDRLIKIDGKDISGFREYMEVTRAHAAGDVVPVNVVRGDEELVLNVELQTQSQQRGPSSFSRDE